MLRYLRWTLAWSLKICGGVRLSMVLGLCLVLLAGGVGAAVASGRSVSGRSTSRVRLGPQRAWGGTEIRSLDPLTAAAAETASLAGRLVSSSRGSSVSGLGQAPDSSATPGSGTTPGFGTATRSMLPDQRLSNETTFTRWAFVTDPTPIYAQPRAASARVARLHWYTEDGFPEVYLLLRAHWDARGQEWIELRVPMRPNGRTGWVRRQALDRFHVTHTEVIVDRSRLRMYFLQNGRRIWNAPIGVGKPSTPTPSGHFWIRERFKITDPGSGYWPYAFGTSDYSTLSDWPGGGVVGIHGPYYQAQSIPGRISHGCIRLGTADDAWLAGHIQLGTPLRVL